MSYLNSMVSASDVAIIGMACCFPGAHDLETFWQNLVDGVESIERFSIEECAKNGVPSQLLTNPDYVRAAGVLQDIDLFDASFFNISPHEAELLDPQHRLFLECCWEALEDGGHDPDRYKGRVAVYAGISSNTYMLARLAMLQQSGTISDILPILIGNEKDFLSTRVSYKLNLTGPSVTVQSACSTSLVAVHMACQSLLNGECDMALAGGVTIRVPHRVGYVYQKEHIFSPDGHCRAFDANAQGTVGGNGVGVVLLKRMSDALTEGNQIWAVIKGSAINNDGANKMGYTAPGVSGQASVIAEALAVAGINPDTITYIEAHGTGTRLGDTVEFAALRKVFSEFRPDRPPCAIGSVKTNIGHLDAAAGIAGLIKAALSLSKRKIPPNLHFHSANPLLKLDQSPFFIPYQALDWEGAGKLRAGVSSFGIGGTNAHVVLEETSQYQNTRMIKCPQLRILSARSTNALELMSDRLAEYFVSSPEISLADIAFTLQAGRKRFEHRRFLVSSDSIEAARLLQMRDRARVHTCTEEGGSYDTAFLFSGEGSVDIPMAARFYSTQKEFRIWVERCAKILRSEIGPDLQQWMLTSHTVEHKPMNTVSSSFALPALFVFEYSLARLWMAWGIYPKAMIGYGVGELVAACIAGVFRLEDALAIVVCYQQYLQDLAEGVPASIGREQVRKCYMQAMVGVLLKAPKIPFISNITGTWITDEEATDSEHWMLLLQDELASSQGLSALDGTDTLCVS